LNQLLKSSGWIDVARYGRDVDHDVFYLVQHGEDLAFQKRALAALSASVASGESDPRLEAFLFDRVAVAERRLQRFGTQGECALVEGRATWIPDPVEEPAQLSVRRRNAGLPPIDDAQNKEGLTCATILKMATLAKTGQGK
jgi:hypothetical protein